jgi:hypothetical protein
VTPHALIGLLIGLMLPWIAIAVWRALGDILDMRTFARRERARARVEARLMAAMMCTALVPLLLRNRSTTTDDLEGHPT